LNEELVITPHSIDKISIDYDKKLFNSWWDYLLENNIIDRPHNENDLSTLGKIYRFKGDSIELAEQDNSLKIKFRKCAIF